MRIGIIGAGIGGLTAALGLQRTGHEVVLYERSELLRPVGAGISLFGNAVAALAAAGLDDIVDALGPSHAAEYTAGQRQPSGRWLTRLPVEATEGLRIVHRAQLHAALVGALAPGTLRTGLSVEPSIEGTLRADDGGELEVVDLVIAADGIRSASRRVLELDTGVRYAGYTAWRGVTERPVELAGEAGETWGRGRRFGIAPLPDGRVYWFATQSQAAGAEFTDERAEVAARFGDWHDPIPELMAATEDAAIIRHDVHELTRPLASFARGRVALLGDAAHAMTPDLGQGGGQAIEDAATLTLLLDGALPEALAARLAAYDRIRRGRVQPIAAQARRMGWVGQWSAGVAVGIRDTLLRALPAGLLGRAARDVQRWSAPALVP